MISTRREERKKKSLGCWLPEGWRSLLSPDLVSRACWHWLWRWGFLITSFQQFQSLPRSRSLCLPPLSLYLSCLCYVFRFCYSPAALQCERHSSSVLEKVHCVFVCVRGGEENIHHTRHMPIHVFCRCVLVALLNIPMLWCVDAGGGRQREGVSWQQPSLIWSASTWVRLQGCFLFRAHTPMYIHLLCWVCTAKGARGRVS